MTKIKSFVRMIRLKQWIKNLIVLFPIFFGKAFHVSLILQALLAFLAFSFLASSIYIINDIADVEKDRKHPVKCKRPIAAGEIRIFSARITSVICFILGIVCVYFAENRINIIAYAIYGIYFILNLLYSFWAKNVPLLDILILASGFLLRLYFGSVILDVVVSSWLYLVIMAGAFYLGLGKRRNELKKIEQNKERTGSRSVLQYYNFSFLDRSMHQCMTLAIVFYSLWCATYESTKSGPLLLTVPLVIVIAMKYSLNIESEVSEGDPTDTILGDKILLVLCLLLAISIFSILYVI